MKRILNYITVSVLLLSSCSFLEEENTSYPTADYYDSAQKIKTGLNGCYDPLRSIYGAGMFQLTECASDIIYLSSYTRPDANCAYMKNQVWTDVAFLEYMNFLDTKI